MQPRTAVGGHGRRPGFDSHSKRNKRAYLGGEPDYSSVPPRPAGRSVGWSVCRASNGGQRRSAIFVSWLEALHYGSGRSGTCSATSLSDHRLMRRTTNAADRTADQSNPPAIPPLPQQSPQTRPQPWPSNSRSVNSVYAERAAKLCLSKKLHHAHAPVAAEGRLAAIRSHARPPTGQSQQSSQTHA
ncbi:unnamed protein product [Soboliphyme baturini]|uniref:Uncharacterized protein n=1 Tax=Soboliphyme baturini TaxID=241478 RepID=A0A183IRY2_9BILA|nr:unnamed protein product [Soboliphyme baturini]